MHNFGLRSLGALAVICFLGLTAPCHLQAQQDPLPRGLSAEEKLLVGSYQTPDVGSAPVNFTMPVRSMAEWEELQAVVITWTSFPSILSEIVRAIQPECTVVIVCSNESIVKNYLAGKGIDWSDNISFLEAPYNSIWVRDYGPNSVYLNDVDSLVLVDWIYNRPRPKDDAVPLQVGNLLDIPVVGTTVAPDDLVHTGGNFMSDGMGLGFSSELVYEENGPFNNYGTSNHSPAEVDALMEKFMGVSPYVTMTNLPFDLIHHIDMHMKLLDEETLLVGEYPPGVADGPQIEANLQYVLDNFTTSFGTPFRVIRVPMPPDNSGKYPNMNGDYWTYTNSLIANKTIIVPTYKEAWDTTALRIYREAMPGYHVVGIDCKSIIPLSGALHCITKEVGVADPLRIVHQELADDAVSNNGYRVEALIQHKSGIASAKVYFTTDTLAGYSSADMIAQGDDQWEGMIPEQSPGVRVFYYIEAVATSGKVIQRPLTAPSGAFTFTTAESTSLLPVQSVPVRLNPVFPNPARAITCIPVELGDYAGPLRIELVNALGQSTQLAEQSQSPGGLYRVFFNAQEFASGMYTVLITTAQGKLQQPVVIQQ